MTIEEIADRKRTFEADVLGLIAAFQEETRCVVTHVEINGMDVTMLQSPERRTYVSSVRATVQVP